MGYILYSLIVVVGSLILAIPTYGISLIAPFLLVNWVHFITSFADSDQEY